jgi:hypothetical protein
LLTRRVQVLRPGENLQRPEPEEEHAEDGDRDPPRIAIRSAI